MSQLRRAALVTLIAAAGCYREAPPESTLPDPRYVSGPPGGAMDPGDGEAPSGSGPAARAPADPGEDTAGDPGVAQAPDDEAAPDVATAPSDPLEGSPDPWAEAAPGGPGAPAPDGVAQLGDGAAAPAGGDPTAGVTDPEIDATLDGYGQWVETGDYGQVWRPDATVVGVDFTPYESGGSWAYTDAGWAFACDYPWGWLPFHYGRWAWFHGFWGWVPGYHWGPAWVEWRHGGGVVGWRPLAPRFRDHHRNDHRWHGGDAPLRDHRRPEQHDAHWRFATTSDFGRPHIRSHLYGNTADGLRMTSAVKAPPLRAGSAVRARDLMRGRFSAGGRLAHPGSRAIGSPAVRDHRGADPAQTYRPPMRVQPGQPPVRSYQPPVRSYQPPVRSYQPPAYRPPAYRPPVYRPPGQTQPPARAFQPRPPSAPPPRAWSPPSHSSSPPPRSSSPPSHSGGSRPSPSSSGSHSSSSHGGSSHSGGGHHR